MQYVHTNLIAKDWRKLSSFYQEVFDCKPIGPLRSLSGRWLDDLTGIKNCQIEGVHLALPDAKKGRPTLEIFTYPKSEDVKKAVNAFGFSHIAFETENVNDTVDRVVLAGGAMLGSVVMKDYGDMGIGTFAYVKDPEGNVIELQSWQR